VLAKLASLAVNPQSNRGVFIYRGTPGIVDVKIDASETHEALYWSGTPECWREAILLTLKEFGQYEPLL
jgi:hypothetical protein